MRDRQTTESGRDAKSSAPPLTTRQGLSSSATHPYSNVSWLGLPHVDWSLTLIGLCIYTFVIVTYYLPIAIVGIAIAMVGLILQRDKLRIPSPVRLYGAFILWAYIASYASPYSDIALDRVLESLKLLTVMLVVVNALQQEGQLRFYLLFFLVCFMLFPIRGTLVGGDTLAGGRVVWNYIYSNPNELAALSLIALGVALAFLFSRSSRTIVKLGAGLSVILLLVVVLLTQSRGAFIALVAGIISALVWLVRKRPFRLLIVIGMLTLIASVAIHTGISERLSGNTKPSSIETILESEQRGRSISEQEASASERMQILIIALQIFVNNPVFGVGLGAYSFENAKYSPEIGRRDAHNTYLSLAAETGLPGLALWCAMVWSVLRYAYRSRRLAAPGDRVNQQAWIERAFWGYLVASIFGSFAALPFPYLMLAVLWCSATLLASSSQPPDIAATQLTKA